MSKYYWYDSNGAMLFQDWKTSTGWHVSKEQEEKQELKSWVSSGSYNESYEQFYIFKKPMGLWERTPPPTGAHIVR